MPNAPRNGSLLVIFLTVFIDLLGFGMVLPLLPIYAKQFGVDEHGVLLGLLMASFSAMQFLFSPLWGRLSDRVGRRPVMMVGLSGSTAFYALFGVATAHQSLLGLFVARIGAGIAGATISTAQAYIADTTTLETRAKGMALIGAAFGLGFTFGPLLCAAALVFSHDIAVSPMPGYAASALSCVALVLAIFKLPESLQPGSESAVRGFFDTASLRDALATPSIGMLLLTSFIGILAFGSFETTISLLLKSEVGAFQYEPYQIVLFFAYIGLVLSLAQGLLVRRLAGRLTETTMAGAGSVVSVLGFVLLVSASGKGNLGYLMLAAATDVVGFAFITPSLNSLISRRSNPEKQGGILGVTQSVGSLARIVCPMITMPLFAMSLTLPYWVAVGLMTVALGLLMVASRGGKDYAVPMGPGRDG
jgi:MFS family permease